MNKKDWTPEELQLKAALDKLYETDTRVPSKLLDLSFMEKTTETSSKNNNHKVFLRIAAVIAIVLVSSFTTAIFISNDYASAMKTAIKQKIFTINSGVTVISDDEFVEEGEVVWEINDYETAIKAKKIVPELPLPGYLPDGYEFESLTLSQQPDNKFYSYYSYGSQNDTLSFIAQTLSGEDNAYAYTPTKTISLPDRNVIIWEDPLINMVGATVILNNSTIQITSSISDFPVNALIEICESLY